MTDFYYQSRAARKAEKRREREEALAAETDARNAEAHRLSTMNARYLLEEAYPDEGPQRALHQRMLDFFDRLGIATHDE